MSAHTTSQSAIIRSVSALRSPRSTAPIPGPPAARLCLPPQPVVHVPLKTNRGKGHQSQKNGQMRRQVGLEGGWMLEHLAATLQRVCWVGSTSLTAAPNPPSTSMGPENQNRGKSHQSQENGQMRCWRAAGCLSILPSHSRECVGSAPHHSWLLLTPHRCSLGLRVRKGGKAIKVRKMGR
jgi:hypothetical protein